MVAAATIVLVLAAAALGVVLFNVAGWRRVGAHDAHGRASVLIPARNEEPNIAVCLETVIDQPGVQEILVADDGSTDRTAEIVRQIAMRDPRVRVIHPGPVPPGWGGKTNACRALADAASGEWLLFLDADARLADGAAQRMIGEATRREVTLLSCWPQLDMAGFFERLLMPLLNFVLLTMYPAPLAARRRDTSLGLAHGACILARASEYRAIGGHAAVRGELFEDTRLAQHWRASGHRSLCLDGTGTVSVRMYDSLAGIWSGFRKNLFPAFRTQAAFWAFMLLHAAVFLAPFVLAALADGTAALLWACAAGAVVLARVALALRFGHPLWAALLHPVAEVFLLAIGIASWWQVVTGRGVEWKGRRYRAEGGTA